jgi:hypothetical protein
MEQATADEEAEARLFHEDRSRYPDKIFYRAADEAIEIARIRRDSHSRRPI